MPLVTLIVELPLAKVIVPMVSNEPAPAVLLPVKESVPPLRLTVAPLARRLDTSSVESSMASVAPSATLMAVVPMSVPVLFKSNVPTLTFVTPV